MARVGFYAGSFDPPTRGHLDLVPRALCVVDRLVMGVGAHADKRPWLDLETRVRLLRELVPERVEVLAFEGLAVTAARAAGASLLVRGVRGPEDLAGEVQMARANRLLDPGLETILLPAAPETAHISSRLVREVHRARGDVELFVPALVARALSRAAADPPGGPP